MLSTVMGTLYKCRRPVISSFLSDIPIISIMKIDAKSKIRLFPGKEMT